jgi:predicted acylesterase/phospholipase RssA
MTVRWVIRVILGVLAASGALALTAVILFVTWMPAPDAAPPPASPASESETESGVTWLPGIGPRQYGACIRVLSIDGGGMRGLIPALVLAEIEKRTGRPIAEDFDVVAGTSTGAIIALGLTRPSDADARRPAFSAQDLVGFYKDHGAEVFPNYMSFLFNIRRLFVPKYTPHAIERVFGGYFGDVRLVESLSNVLISGYDIEDHRRLWFSSLSGPDAEIAMSDLVRGATAAPTYLPPARFSVPQRVSLKGYVTLVDGALFANNPSLEALRFGDGVRPPDTDHSDRSILLLSLGTGHSSASYSYERAWRWGVLGWVDPLLEIAFDDPAVEEEASRAVEQNPNNRYFRFQVQLGPHPRTMDDSSPAEIARLTQLTEDLIARKSDDLGAVAAELALPRSPRCGFPIGPDYARPEGPRKPAASAGP